MFEYVCNEFNPDPRLVVGGTPKPAGRLVVDIPYSSSLLLEIPRTAEQLRLLRSRKYWSKLRRNERLLDPSGDRLRFSVARSEPALCSALPQVQRLFAERWDAEYTSFGWKTEAGFAPYADAMTGLAADGRGELVLLHDGEDLISFAYCLLQDHRYYFYQHASTVAEHYRPLSVGKVLIARLLQDLVADRRAEILDFMTGAADYKREWTSTEQPILRRLTAERSASGGVRLAGTYLATRAKFAVQFGHPRVRATAKAVLLARERLRQPAGVPAPAGTDAVNTRTP